VGYRNSKGYGTNQKGGMISNDDDHGRIAREMIRKTVGMEGVVMRYGTWGEKRGE
jgi:hypothetical protein